MTRPTPLAILVVLVLAALVITRTVRRCREWYTADTSGYSSQRWGCPRGLVEFERGCYDPQGKVYMPGKQLVTEDL